MKLKLGISILLIALTSVFRTYAQQAAVKTNLVGAALLNVNLGVELSLTHQWTFEVPASLNKWILDNTERNDGKRWKHWFVQPGARYWFCGRYDGHFIGVHIHGGQYNLAGFKGKVSFPGWDGDGNYTGTDFRNIGDTRYHGWFAGGGISYGYAWILDRHWNIEAEIGLGYAYSRYDKFRCAGCGQMVEHNRPHHYAGPTKAAINLVYLF
ncbi:MAG: DUF3575 domain-containing protein [Alistipes sp.]|nr:DUF3575 domain-containing protein [Alistipes sp.]